MRDRRRRRWTWSRSGAVVLGLALLPGCLTKDVADGIHTRVPGPVLAEHAPEHVSAMRFDDGAYRLVVRYGNGQSFVRDWRPAYPWTRDPFHRHARELGPAEIPARPMLDSGWPSPIPVVRADSVAKLDADHPAPEGFVLLGDVLLFVRHGERMGRLVDLTHVVRGPDEDRYEPWLIPVLPLALVADVTALSLALAVSPIGLPLLLLAL